MKTIEMDDAHESLGKYAGREKDLPIVVTDHGRPVAALLPVPNADLETISLSTNPKFIAMIERSREIASHEKYTNVEFRLGEIENLPVADNTADVIISNCVINLSTDKPRVFKEAYRTLKPGGRLMVSDLVLLASFRNLSEHQPAPT